ncbi:MAG: tRNA pseudouridine(55) synthase TruB [Lachnospiraceae bacterium]|nr:tRNA pseudouridine(55) synthase TruB [Lachnospiraceae bacterium]
MDGILIVYKEPGFTSHDVVAKLRGILRQKKIGHTGTLDPEATGVLPVCLGKATKVCGLLTDWNKTYRAELLLGRTTDTQDMTGKVLRECPVFLADRPDAVKQERMSAGEAELAEAGPMYLTEEEIRGCIAGFAGEQQQIPPMYSALKVNGRKLYELARQGIEVERKPRTIHIDEIRIGQIARSDLEGAKAMIRVEMTVRCSKGTYIRTLCHDIGEKLGCGGCMDLLCRTEVGPFALRDTWRLSEIEELRDADDLEKCIFSTDCAFTNLDAVWLSADAERLVRNGNPLSASIMKSFRRVDDLNERFSDRRSMAYENWMVLAGRAESAALFGDDYSGPPHRSDQLRLYAPNGEFLAVYGYERERDRWRAEMMFL